MYLTNSDFDGGDGGKVKGSQKEIPIPHKSKICVASKNV